MEAEEDREERGERCEQTGTDNCAVAYPQTTITSLSLPSLSYAQTHTQNTQNTHAHPCTAAAPVVVSRASVAIVRSKTAQITHESRLIIISGGKKEGREKGGLNAKLGPLRPEDTKADKLRFII